MLVFWGFFFFFFLFSFISFTCYWHQYSAKVSEYKHTSGEWKRLCRLCGKNIYTYIYIFLFDGKIMILFSFFSFFIIINAHKRWAFPFRLRSNEWKWLGNAMKYEKFIYEIILMWKFFLSCCCCCFENKCKRFFFLWEKHGMNRKCKYSKIQWILWDSMNR